MTTSGDIAQVDAKLNLSSRNKSTIPEFSSYLDKVLKDKSKSKKNKPKINGNTNVIPVKLDVFKTLTEELFFNIQTIIRNNGIDIKSLTVNENKTLTENSNQNSNPYNISYNGFEKSIEFYDENDCEYVYNGFSEYLANVDKKDSVTLVFKW